MSRCEVNTMSHREVNTMSLREVNTMSRRREVNTMSRSEALTVKFHQRYAYCKRIKRLSHQSRVQLRRVAHSVRRFLAYSCVRLHTRPLLQLRIHLCIGKELKNIIINVDC